MVVIVALLIVVLLFGPALVQRSLARGRLRSPIEPGAKKSSLPEPQDRSAPAIRDGKATEETLMEDFAEGRISVEEYERLLDQLYRSGPT